MGNGGWNAMIGVSVLPVSIIQLLYKNNTKKPFQQKLKQTLNQWKFEMFKIDCWTSSGSVLFLLVSFCIRSSSYRNYNFNLQGNEANFMSFPTLFTDQQTWAHDFSFIRLILELYWCSAESEMCSCLSPSSGRSRELQRVEQHHLVWLGGLMVPEETEGVSVLEFCLQPLP